LRQGRHFIGLITPAELDTLTALNERVLRHLADEPSPERWHGEKESAE
jgi:hypothetical protein